MKFVCLKCEAYMAFQKVEAPEEGRLGITFACDSCGARFSMVTNPGETQLVSSLGVSLGGRTAPLAPLEMTRGTLKSDPTSTSASMAEYMSARAGSTVSPKASAAPAGAGPVEEKAGGCPFSAVVRDMGLGANAAPAGDAVEPSWTQPAREQLDRLPSYVRHVLKGSIEEYARKHGFAVITPDVMAAAKRGTDGLDWSPEASARLTNIPDFVRPMARREIERLARAAGATTVTAETMDQAKDVFGMGA